MKTLIFNQTIFYLFPLTPPRHLTPAANTPGEGELKGSWEPDISATQHNMLYV